jgi:hypothetical protein
MHLLCACTKLPLIKLIISCTHAASSPCADAMSRLPRPYNTLVVYTVNVLCAYVLVLLTAAATRSRYCCYCTTLQPDLHHRKICNDYWTLLLYTSILILLQYCTVMHYAHSNAVIACPLLRLLHRPPVAVKQLSCTTTRTTTISARTTPFTTINSVFVILSAG